MTKVLIIDDDTNTVKFLSVALSKNGYKPCGAYDGKEGLEKVDVQAVDEETLLRNNLSFVLFLTLLSKHQ